MGWWMKPEFWDTCRMVEKGQADGSVFKEHADSGKLKYNPFANSLNDFCYVLSTNGYKKGILDIKKASYYEPSIKEEEYQVLICPNKTAINHSNTNVVIGNVEFMKSFLNIFDQK